MKIGIIGVGAVGVACAKSILLKSSCQEVLLFDVIEGLAKGVATDLEHGAQLFTSARIRACTQYEELTDVSVFVITAGINEKAGKAIHRDSKLGRLLLLPPNVATYRNIIPNIARVAPKATILVVTDPPDPLADIARQITQTNPIISAGTYLDSLRFRLQLARRLQCSPTSVHAYVLGEHGTSQVYVWSSAQIGGESVLDHVAQTGTDTVVFRAEIEKAVKYANIDIIEGTGASQHGIGMVTARLVSAMVDNEGLVEPVGIYQPAYGVTFSLPAIITHGGRPKIIKPTLSQVEEQQLTRSAECLSDALKPYL